MNRNTLRQWVNVVTYIGMLVVNGLANALPLNGLTTGDIADRFDVYFVPAAYVFSIWGLIYVALGAFTVYQALPPQRDNPRLRRVGYLFALSSLANASWIFLWHYEQFALSLIAMLTLLGSLIAIYLRLNVGRAEVPAVERWLVNVPFSIYLGWITVATIANVTSVLDYVGWGGWGIAETVWAAIMLVAGTAIAAAMSVTRGDVAYLLVIIWAYVGIAVKYEPPLVSTSAWVLAGVVAVLLVVGAYLRQQRADMPALP
jgi:hypothetical protein